MRRQAYGIGVRTSSRLLLCVTLLVTLLCTPGPTRAINCRICHPDLCPPVPRDQCHAGVVTDICGCCQECARALNETCGGKYGIFGKCGPGLKCFISPAVGQAISGQDDGICRAFGPDNCTSEDCEAIGDVTLQCPFDSDLIVNTTGATTRSLCVCNYSYCTVPVCAAGFESVLLSPADLRPGSCCDEFVCKRTAPCRSVICPPAEDKTCPQDSYELPNQLTDDGCCYIKKRCKCKGMESCPSVQCPEGSQLQIISKATDMPGSCCDRFHCVNDTGHTCRYEGQTFHDGESWQLEKCTMCECRDGLTFCKTKTCNAPLCGWMVIPEGECCPVCKGCVSDSGSLYNNSDVWKESPCVTCQCDAGRVLCQAEMCAVRCSKPRQVPGQCCPVCDDIPEEDTPRLCPDSRNCSLTCPNGLEKTDEDCFLCKCKKEKCKLACKYGFTTNANGTKNCECAEPQDHCPSLDTCEKQCTYGYKKSRNGCRKCRCNKCPPFNCTKWCLYGYNINDQGCQLCKCKEALMIPSTPSTDYTDPSLFGGDKSCMSLSGHLHEDGESWHDGCRMCYCHNGNEMCSLIACPVPRCDNPVFRVGDCCPSCPGVLGIPSENGSKQSCQSTNGQHLVEGETWRMDDCTQCICHDGSILCESATCPAILCYHPVKSEDQCCAHCTASDHLPTVPRLSARPCKSDSGVVYKQGEVWKTSPCQSCTCRNGQVHCYSQMCPPLNCNKTVLRKGQCCPSCLEVSLPGICTKDDITYSTGERWQSDNCTECVCENGKILCVPIPCPRLTCTVMIRKPTQCCPSCLDASITTSILEQHFPRTTTNHHNRKYTTQGPTEDFKAKDNYMIGIVLLGVLLSIALIAVLVLVLVILRRRHTGMFKMTDSPVVTKIRPKSTNLELQGVNPFLLDSPSKQINCERKQKLEKHLASLGPAVIANEKSKLDLSPNHQYQLINTNPGFEPKKDPHGNCVSNKTFDQA
ncbi:cysteine-rich motor neuron 1 protein-like [Haliotis asinina]|uniref:cysteine-rich motor neuron 1 protein-like n=1 Tax=Haliotis asinina TaxID=109174 RepID=UPI003531D9F3